MRRRTFIAGLAAGLIAPPAWAAPAKRTFRYARTRDVDANLQSLDVYGAEEGARRPILAFLHGGAWSGGDKASRAHGRDKAKFFAAQGFVFASVNYRLSPAVKHPAHIEDTAAAVAFLRKRAGEIGGDPEQLYVMGHSAGAHLAALVSTDERRLAAHGETLRAIKGAILLDGAGYDIVAQTRSAPAWAERFFKSVLGSDPGDWDDASPVRHVASGKNIPPFLIIYTARVEAVGQSFELASLLRKAGVEARLFLAQGENHMQVNRNIGKAGHAATAQIMAALNQWRAQGGAALTPPKA